MKTTILCCLVLLSGCHSDVYHRTTDSKQQYRSGSTDRVAQDIAVSWGRDAIQRAVDMKPEAADFDGVAWAAIDASPVRVELKQELIAEGYHPSWSDGYIDRARKNMHPLVVSALYRWKSTGNPYKN